MRRSIRPKRAVSPALARTIAPCAVAGIAHVGRLKWAPGIGPTGAAVMVRRLPWHDDSRRAEFLLPRPRPVRDREGKAQPLRLPAEDAWPVTIFHRKRTGTWT